MAVVMGSGFEFGRNCVDFCPNGCARLSTADFLYSTQGIVACIIVVGWEKHSTKSYYFAPEAKRYLLRRGIPYSKVFQGTLKQHIDTRADVESAIDVIRGQGFDQMEILVITEAPHWHYRVEPLFQELAPELNVTFQSSGALVLPWYWIKEAIAGSFLWLIGDRSGLYSRIREGGKKIIHFLF